MLAFNGRLNEHGCLDTVAPILIALPIYHERGRKSRGRMGAGDKALLAFYVSNRCDLIHVLSSSCYSSMPAILYCAWVIPLQQFFFRRCVLYITRNSSVPRSITLSVGLQRKCKELYLHRQHPPVSPYSLVTCTVYVQHFHP